MAIGLEWKLFRTPAISFAQASHEVSCERGLLIRIRVAAAAGAVTVVSMSGLVFADAITTVSPDDAREITEAAGGCGLEGIKGPASRA